METNINVEIINTLAIKIANLEVQVAAQAAENKALQNQMNGASESENNESFEPSQGE